MKDFWSKIPLHENVKLIAADANGLAALNKGVGLLSHPNKGGLDTDRSLIQASWTQDGAFYEIPAGGGRTQRIYLLNRLDSATSGVILVAANAKLANAVRLMFMRKHVHKVYNALVFGLPSERKQTWKDRLNVEKRGGTIRTESGSGIPAESSMKVLQQSRGKGFVTALLELTPKTGRSHQLRVQCAKRGLPIIGDATYGDFKLNREFAKQTGAKRLFLHSLETAFEYDWEGKSFRFRAKAELPKEFLEY